MRAQDKIPLCPLHQNKGKNSLFPVQIRSLTNMVIVLIVVRLPFTVSADAEAAAAVVAAVAAAVGANAPLWRHLQLLAAGAVARNCNTSSCSSSSSSSSSCSSSAFSVLCADTCYDVVKLHIC